MRLASPASFCLSSSSYPHSPFLFFFLSTFLNYSLPIFLSSSPPLLLPVLSCSPALLLAVPAEASIATAGPLHSPIVRPSRGARVLHVTLLSLRLILPPLHNTRTTPDRIASHPVPPRIPRPVTQPLGPWRPVGPALQSPDNADALQRRHRNFTLEPLRPLLAISLSIPIFALLALIHCSTTDHPRRAVDALFWIPATPTGAALENSLALVH